MPVPMPRSRRLLYAAGASGWQISDRIVFTIAIYFYLPPADRGLETLVPDEIFLGFLTVYGLASLVGRFFDAFADPFVGHGSDRSRSRLGRRRTYMIFGLGPMVGLPVLLFWPPAEAGSAANGVWVAVVFSLFYVFFTVYVAPYLALMPEIARGDRERVDLSTAMAVAAIPAYFFGVAWSLGFDWGVAAGLTPTASMRLVVVAGSVIALALCLLPIAAVDEERFCHAERSDLSLWKAVRATLANGPFRRYIVAQLPFIVGINMMQPAGVYYSTVVLGRSEGFAAQLGVALFAGTAAAFLPVNRIARRVGAKRTIASCVGLLSVALALQGLVIPDVPGGAHDVRNLALLFAAAVGSGIAVAGFLVMPNVLLGQVVDYDTLRTGANRAAMYFGMQGLFTKFLYGVSSAILAFLFSRFGNSAAEPLGVILIGPVASAFCLVSVLLFVRYPEKEVLAATLRLQRRDPD